MKKAILILLIFIFVFSLSADNIYFYTAGHNELSANAQSLVTQLSGYDLNHNLAVEINSGEGTDARYIAKKGYLNKITNIPYKDTADLEKIKFFFEFSKNRLPDTDRNVVIFWGHGFDSDGYCSFLFDKNFNNEVNLHEFKELLNYVDKKIGGIDLLILDGCHLADFEFLYEISHIPKFIIASPQTVEGREISYTNLLQKSWTSVRQVINLIRSEKYYLFNYDYLKRTIGYIKENKNQLINNRVSGDKDYIFDLAREEKVTSLFFPLESVWNENNAEKIVRIVKQRINSKFAKENEWYKFLNSNYGDIDLAEKVSLSYKKIFPNKFRLMWDKSFDISGIDHYEIKKFTKINKVYIEQNDLEINEFVYDEGIYSSGDTIKDYALKTKEFYMETNFLNFIEFDYRYFIADEDTDRVTIIIYSDGTIIKKIESNQKDIDWTTKFIDISKYNGTNISLEVLIYQEGSSDFNLSMVWIRDMKILSINKNELTSINTSKPGLTAEVPDNMTYHFTAIPVDENNKKGYYSDIINITESGYEDEKFRIFPNPCRSSFINVNIKTKTLDYLIIYDTKGKELIKKKIYSTNNTAKTVKIDVSSLSNGIYYVKLFDQIKKFVKIR